MSFIPYLYNDKKRIIGFFHLFLQLVLKPHHFAVFSVNLKAPDNEGTFAAEVIVATQFDVSFLYVGLNLTFHIDNIFNNRRERNISQYYPCSYFRDACISVSPCLSHHKSKSIHGIDLTFTHDIHIYSDNTL